MNKVILFLSIKDLYNEYIRREVSAIVINILADAFKLAHHSSVKAEEMQRFSKQ